MDVVELNIEVACINAGHSDSSFLERRKTDKKDDMRHNRHCSRWWLTQGVKHGSRTGCSQTVVQGVPYHTHGQLSCRTRCDARSSRTWTVVSPSCWSGQRPWEHLLGGSQTCQWNRTWLDPDHIGWPARRHGRISRLNNDEGESCCQFVYYI